MRKGLPSDSSRTWLTMMLVEVPTSVTRPPSSDMKLIGISSAETELRSDRPSLSAVGIRIAIAPTFLVIIDRIAVAPAITGTCTLNDFSRDTSGRIDASNTPDRAIAALTTRAEAITTTTSLVKPVKACLAGTTPTIIPISSATTEIRS